ncbi:MAG: methyl-accepting chemotaxis protein [Pseudomonadota bacterium]
MLTSFSLKQVIASGFGLVLLLMALLAMMSLRGTSNIGDVFTDYRQAARESLLVNDAKIDLITARLGVMQYRISNDEAAAERVANSVTELRALNDEISSFLVDQNLVAQITGLEGSLDDYKAGFAEVVDIQARRNELVPQMNQVGRDARTTMTEIIESAYNDADIEAAYYGGLVQQHLMLARYYGEKFLLENREDDRDRTYAEIETVRENMRTLLASLQNPVRRRLAAQFDAQVNTFEGHYGEIVSLIETRNGILRDRLDSIGPELMAGYNSVLSTVVHTQNTLGPQASADVATTLRNTTIIAVVAFALGVAAAFLIGRLLSGSIARVVGRMNELAGGQLDIEIIGAERKDELGDMARALLVFQENGREKVRIEAEQKEAEAAAEAEKSRAMDAMADDFEANVNGVVTAVSSAAEQMVGLAEVLSEAANRASERSTAVAAASEEASTNVGTVAAASEEMSNSISEVSERVGQAASMTSDAAMSAEDSTQMVGKLAVGAQTIGNVISMISDIAEQTNLLALNATIEAARAGEAGKGFAVVATEVKTLAEQTAKATEQISTQITGMQGDTDAVVSAIEKIGGMIKELNSTSSSIAAAVEEQHSATQEIARNTQQAADGTQEVSENISEVSSAVEQTGSAANDVKAASSQLVGEAQRLRENVGQFLANVRAA